MCPRRGVEFANPSGAACRRFSRQGLWQDRVRAYLAAVSYADAQIGRLLDALDKSPYRDNTIIVFVGDNGWHLGQKEHWGKVTLWNEATRVPLIWVAPGVAKPGTTCEQGVDLMSLYPTLCELAGVPVPKHAEGVSIKPLLADPAAAWTQPGLSTMYKDNHTLRHGGVALHPLRGRHGGTLQRADRSRGNGPMWRPSRNMRT